MHVRSVHHSAAVVTSEHDNMSAQEGGKACARGWERELRSRGNETTTQRFLSLQSRRRSGGGRCGRAGRARGGGLDDDLLASKVGIEKDAGDPLRREERHMRRDLALAGFPVLGGQLAFERLDARRDDVHTPIRLVLFLRVWRLDKVRTLADADV